MEGEKIIGKLKINMYHLANGPYHQDFTIPLPESDGTRISFNLKLAQEVKMSMRVL